MADRTITAAAEGSTVPTGTVPTALESQQAQSVSKARVDLSAMASAVEGAKAVATDNTKYPGQGTQGGVDSKAAGAGGGPSGQKAGSDTGSRGGKLQAEPPSGAAPSGTVPSALASQQAQSAGKAKVDVGAMSATVQGAMASMPSESTSPPARSKDGTSVRTPLLQAHLNKLYRAAERPLAPALPHPPSELPETASAARVSRTGGDVTTASESAVPARPPPDSVSPASIQGSTAAIPHWPSVVMPAGSSGAGAPASLGFVRATQSRVAAGDRLLLAIDTSRRVPPLAQDLIDCDHARRMTRACGGRSEDEHRRATALSEEAGRLLRDARLRRDSGAITSAVALETRAQDLRSRADRHDFAAAAFAREAAEWADRVEELVSATRRVTGRGEQADDLGLAAAFAEAGYTPPTRNRMPDPKIPAAVTESTCACTETRRA